MVCFIAKKALNFIHRCKMLSFLLVVLISGRKLKPFMLSTKLIISLTTSLHLYHMSTVLIFVLTSKNYHLWKQMINLYISQTTLISPLNIRHLTSPTSFSETSSSKQFLGIFLKEISFLELDRLRYRHI